ncbi:hypothetical protein COEREDRAFT_79238 [Coemansia reversa NRRL 1564]|uniref:Uncharacterized protein n=1 Tax=Coemansia reversa (strain ATCC 12441 / NRRL 1564) TaxID=763665 RepID=A0A2G5BJU9_COERN|nr:hypothetical protein COEREDRAFT_79238 [Coemansia reversa NRRL 1564]|eukprot:PIA19286.1 hypothetical protein COEREDRAFT_79238 [Coemansia reversa NRRL 1564]
MPPPTPGVPPVEHHPYNDDWGTTLVAILLMSLIVFIVLGVLIKKSFQLVPTGVLALRTIVGGSSEGYHRLDDVNEDEQHGVQERTPQTHAIPQRPYTEDPAAIAQDSQRRTELLSDSEFENDEVNNDDAQVLRIDRTDGH